MWPRSTDVGRPGPGAAIIFPAHGTLGEKRCCALRHKATTVLRRPLHSLLGNSATPRVTVEAVVERDRGDEPQSPHSAPWEDSRERGLRRGGSGHVYSQGLGTATCGRGRAVDGRQWPRLHNLPHSTHSREEPLMPAVPVSSSCDIVSHYMRRDSGVVHPRSVQALPRAGAPLAHHPHR